jgi:hypothetical protein
MPLWGKNNQANNAPKYTTSVVSGKTGIQDYGNTVLFSTGNDGFNTPPGWVKKTVGTGGRAGRIFYESLVALPTAYSSVIIPPSILGAVTYTIDGSVGQVYSAPANMSNIQWYQKSLSTPFTFTQINGATSNTYTSNTTDIGSRLIARGTVNNSLVDAVSLMPVLDIPVLFDDYESLTGRTSTGTGTTLSLDTTDKLRGTSSLVVSTGNTPGNNGSQTTPTIDPSQLGVVVVAAKRGSNTFTQFTENFVKGAQGIGTNGGSNSTATASPEWQYLFFDTTSAFAGATSGTTTIRDWQVLAANAVPVVAKYDAKFSKAKGRGFIIASFDDGYDTTYSLAKPLFDNYGFLGTTYSAPNFLTGGGSGPSKFMTLAMQQALYASGWDCGCDSGMNDESFSGLTPTQALAQIDQVQTWNAANIGTRGNEFFCYSMGSFADDQATAIIGSGRYKMGRGIIPGSFYTRFGILTGIQRVYPSMGFSSDTPSNYSTQLASAKALVDLAVSTGCTVSFHHHFWTDSVTSIGTPYTAVALPLYAYIASLRDQGLIDVGTPTQLVARDGIGAKFPI